jgi:hypothetical protein
MKEANVYRDPLEKMSHALQYMLLDTYCIHPAIADEHGWRENGKTLVMPVRDAYGRDRGHVTRTFDTPKRCYTFKATSQPWLDWWLVNDHAPVVVVEDALSACRLAGCGLNACALLGTSMTIEQAKEINAVADERPVHLALDRDAFLKACKLQQRFSHILPNMCVNCLTVDIKNMDSDDDIREMFSGRNEFDSCNIPEPTVL